MLKRSSDEKFKTALEDFFINYHGLKKLLDELDSTISTLANSEKCIYRIYNEIKKVDNEQKELCDESNLNCSYLPDLSVKEGGLFGSLNCSFVKIDVILVKRALYDASVESRILAACSLCASFFGAVAVYFYLLVLHHYNNELFFDSGKSIFTGFDGFGRGYKTKNHNQDPAYKKRKLRSEIELTSKNDEVSNYKDINKNDDDE